MLFPERPITLDHVRDFCAKFNEGVRVEYKSTFDANVRAGLPKIVSSFANSQGGVCVIGINTQAGIPQPPFDGFAAPPREELALTVESICLQNIYPPVLPKTTVISSDTAGRVFLVIEVEESGEAPHAIENSKKVYVRTGNATNPYELAEVELIIDLMKRRKEPLELRDRILRFAEERTNLTVMRGAASAQVSICARFPRNALCSTQDIWQFLNATPYRGANFFPQESLRRVPDGVGAL